MNNISFILLIIASYVGTLQAGQFRKPYFTATKAGTWAKYKMNDNKGNTLTYTYKRLADSDERIIFEHTTFVNSGPGERGTATTLYVLEPGFDFDRNMLSYSTAIQAMIAQNNDSEPNVTTDEVIKIIRETGVDFNKSMDFMNSEKVDEYQCDHYTYKATSGGPRPMTHTGNIWLNEKIPFGVVKHTAVIVEGSNTIGGFNMRLLEFGSDAKGMTALLAKIPNRQETVDKAQPDESVIESYNLREAYEKEKVRLTFEIKEGSGGRRLSIVIENKSADPFFLTVPEGQMDLKAGSPINTLSITIDSENSIKLGPKQSAPRLEIGQTGKRGAIEGRFELTMYNGEPLYMGSVTIGTLE